MELLFIITLVAAALHFVWESILLPTFQTDLRYRLFALRDRLRRRLIDRSISDANAFDVVYGSVNNALFLSDKVGLVSFWRIKRILERNPKLLEQSRARTRCVMESADREMSEIYSAVINIAATSFVLYSGMLVFWLLPLALYAYLSKFFKRMTFGAGEMASQSENSLQQLMAA